MRTTVDLPDPLLRDARLKASARGVTLSVFVADAVRAQMATNDTATVQPFQLRTVRGRLVQPDLDLDRTPALVALHDESVFGGK